MWNFGFTELAYQGYHRNWYHRQSFKATSAPWTWFDITHSALKLKTNQIYKFQNLTDPGNKIQILKSSWNANSVLKHKIRLVVQHTVKFAIIVEIKVILLNVALKRKAFIRSTKNAVIILPKMIPPIAVNFFYWEYQYSKFKSER